MPERGNVVSFSDFDATCESHMKLKGQPIMAQLAPRQPQIYSRNREACERQGPFMFIDNGLVAVGASRRQKRCRAGLRSSLSLDALQVARVPRVLSLI